MAGVSFHNVEEGLKMCNLEYEMCKEMEDQMVMVDITHTDDTQHSNAEICSSPAMTSASSQIRPDGPESSESQAVKAQKK